jgi:hypothetical protein
MARAALAEGRSMRNTKLIRRRIAESTLAIVLVVQITGSGLRSSMRLMNTFEPSRLRNQSPPPGAASPIRSSNSSNSKAVPALPAKARWPSLSAAIRS